MKNIAIFASYNGSGFDALYEAINQQKIDINISVVISNNSDANVIQKAKKRQIPNFVINERKYPNQNISNIIIDILKEYNCDIIFLSGYMKKIDTILIEKFKIYNAHPSLLPKFGGKGMYGRYVHEAVIKSRQKYSGVTIHEVTKNYDEGQIVLQKSLQLNENETVDSLETKIKQLEKLAIVEAFKDKIL